MANTPLDPSNLVAPDTPTSTNVDIKQVLLDFVASKDDKLEFLATFQRHFKEKNSMRWPVLWAYSMSVPIPTINVS